MRKIPHYRQFLSTCGLSSLLMIALPEKDNLQFLLDDICSFLGLNTTHNRVFKWQIACCYLLLTISISPVLASSLKKYLVMSIPILNQF